MTYYIIDNKPVFLSWARNRELFSIVSKDKDPIWRIWSRIVGHKENEEKNELIFDELNKKYLDNPDDFNPNWVEFDLKDKEASENVWDLLYDYCTLYWYAFLSGSYELDLSEKLEADYNLELYRYPMGKVFNLNHFVKPKKWWWKYTYKMKWRVIQVTINTDTVTHIKWNLKEFTIYMWNFKIIFGEKLSISTS